MSENIIQYVIAAGNGDTDAMAKLYSKTLKASYFLASTLCGDKQEAAEITKKAYARAFCNIDKLKKPEAFEIWMKQNVAAAYRETRKFVFGDADAGAVENSAEFLPASILENEELGEKVIRAVTALKPELKTALVLYYNNGMPVQILAKFLGVSESTSNALLSKARNSILSVVGTEASTASAEGELPVITRLFQRKAEEISIDGAYVRDIFIFAIEAYKAVNPVKPVVEEPAAEEEETAAVEPEEEVTEIHAIESESEDAEEDTAEESAQEDTEDAEEDVPVQDETDEPEEAEDEAEEETEEETEKVSDNVLLFKQRISSILDGAPPIDSSYLPKSNEKKEDNTEILIPELIVEPEVEDDTLTDFGAISISKDIEPEVSEEPSIPKAKPYPAPTRPAPQKSNNMLDKVKTDPKMIVIAIIAAVVIVVVAGLGITFLVNLFDGSNDNVVSSDVGYTWNAGGFEACSEIGYLDEDVAYFKSTENGKYGLMDYQGNVIVQPVYDGFERCSIGREYGETDNYHTLVVIGNEKFDITIEGNKPEISQNPHLYHSNATETLDSKSYDERDRYFEGYAAARKNDKWGYVSQDKDKKVVDYKYEAVNDLTPAESAACDYCRPVTDGFIAVKKDGKMGIINLDEDVIVPFEYSNIMPGSDGVFIACKGDTWGVILVGDAKDTFTGVKFNVSADPDVTPDDKDAIGKYKVTNESGANVREDAGADYEQIGELENGKVVNGYATKKAENGKTWVKVKVDGEFGWVSLSYLEEVE